MPAPSYVGFSETADWSSTLNSKATGNRSASVGDVIVALGAGADNSNLLSWTGSGVTLAVQQEGRPASYCEYDAYAGVVASAGNVSGTLGASFSNSPRGGVILQFSSSDGIGASGESEGVAGTAQTCSISVTTTQANSAVSFLFADWDAGNITASVSISGVGNATLLTKIHVAGQYTVYYGYFADVGAAGSKTLVLDAGSGNTTKSDGAALEIKGTAAGGGGQPPRSMHQFRLRRAA